MGASTRYGARNRVLQYSVAVGKQRLADRRRGGLAIHRLHHRQQLLGRPVGPEIEARYRAYLAWNVGHKLT
jgi:hypothetical protein